MKSNISNQQIDELLHKARNEKPVMGLKEVENIIGAGRYTPGIGVKGVHVGINSVIVITGIVVSSFLAYMALKVDDKKITQNQSVSAPAVEQKVVQNGSQISMPVNIREEKSVVAEKSASTQLKHPDLIRPKVDLKNATASTANVVVKEEAAEPASIVPAVINTKKKTLSGEFMITYYYNDQTVEMKIAGDDIKELAINHSIVPESNYDDYSDLIAEGKNYLMGDHSSEVNSLALINYFDTQLHTDNILHSDTPYSFELTSSQLLINKTSQNEEVFRKYKKLYESKTGKIVTEGSTYSYQKGN